MCTTTGGESAFIGVTASATICSLLWMTGKRSQRRKSRKRPPLRRQDLAPTRAIQRNKSRNKALLSGLRFSVQRSALCLFGGLCRAVCSLEGSVRLASEELACAGAADEFSCVNHFAPAGKNFSRRSFDLNSLEHRIVHTHVVGFCADDLFFVGIKNYQVRVGANRNGSFTRIKTE